jgi:hypothetical protein
VSSDRSRWSRRAARICPEETEPFVQNQAGKSSTALPAATYQAILDGPQPRKLELNRF